MNSSAVATAAQIMCLQPRPVQQPFPAQASSNKRRANFDSSPVLLKRQRCTHSLPADDPVIPPFHPGIVSPGVNLRHTEPHHHHHVAMLSAAARPPQGFAVGEPSGDGTTDFGGIHSKSRHIAGVTTPSLPQTSAAATTESPCAHVGHHHPVVAGGSGVNMSFGFGLGFGMVQAEHEPEDQLANQPSRKAMAMTSTPPSPDGLHHNHHLLPSASLSVPAPPPPPPSQKQQHQPWWLQHPKTKHGSTGCSSGSSHQHHRPTCYYCDAPRDTVACERCDKALCDMCTRFCDVCSATWCPCCTVIDYESPQERTLCFDCFDDGGCRRSDGCGSNVDSDGDDVMLSWQ